MEVCLCCYGINFLIQVPFLSLGSRNKNFLVFGSENLLMFLNPSNGYHVQISGNDENESFRTMSL